MGGLQLKGAVGGGHAGAVHSSLIKPRARTPCRASSELKASQVCRLVLLEPCPCPSSAHNGLSPLCPSRRRRGCDSPPALENSQKRFSESLVKSPGAFSLASVRQRRGWKCREACLHVCTLNNLVGLGHWASWAGAPCGVHQASGHLCSPLDSRLWCWFPTGTARTAVLGKLHHIINLGESCFPLSLRTEFFGTHILSQPKDKLECVCNRNVGTKHCGEEPSVARQRCRVAPQDQSHRKMRIQPSWFRVQKPPELPPWKI